MISFPHRGARLTNQTSVYGFTGFILPYVSTNTRLSLSFKVSQPHILGLEIYQAVVLVICSTVAANKLSLLRYLLNLLVTPRRVELLLREWKSRVLANRRRRHILILPVTREGRVTTIWLFIHFPFRSHRCEANAQKPKTAQIPNSPLSDWHRGLVLSKGTALLTKLKGDMENDRCLLFYKSCLSPFSAASVF